MIKSRIAVDEDAVKAYNEEIKTWEGYCRVCKITIRGSLHDMKEHVRKCHGK